MEVHHIPLVRKEHCLGALPNLGSTRSAQQARLGRISSKTVEEDHYSFLACMARFSCRNGCSFHSFKSYNFFPEEFLKAGKLNFRFFC
jgi:sulfatase maturation enzyme AslB (radical SAM superfamily)